MNMNMLNPCLSVLAIALVGTLAGCSTASTKAPDISAGLRTSLDQAGFKDVAASEDLDKGVVTLTGHVVADSDKTQAETIAKGIAGSQVVSNQIAVVPPGVESQAKAINADLDKGIEKNLDAALIIANLHDNVKYDVKNHVVTLTGAVDSQAKRVRSGQVALAVLNVEQVVNELQVRGQKVTSN
jgi:osmotically-inducible protein OsmY